MNLISIKKNYFFTNLNNLKSENIGLFSSFLIHFIILLFAIGLPDFFGKKSINIPSVIPIEIINVSETTSLTKENIEKKEKKFSSSSVIEKKFNNSDNIDLVKTEIKQKPEIKEDTQEIIKKIKPENILEKKADIPENVEKEIIQEKMEIVPIKKVKVKLKPKKEKSLLVSEKKPDFVTKAKPKPKPKENLTKATSLKDLRNELSKIIEEQEAVKKDENITDLEDKKIEENAELSISEIDLLVRQLQGCWVATAGANIEKGMIVKISVRLNQNGRILDDSIRIVDTNIGKNSPVYGPITESAIRTLLNPDCIPLRLPENKYDTWKKLTITFDHKMMRG